MQDILPAFNSQKLTDYALTYGLKAFYALMILLVGLLIAGIIGRGLLKVFKRSHKMDPMVAGFLSSLVRYVLIATVVIASLDMIGVKSTSLVAILGASTLAIGLALQGTLSHFASGIMLLSFRPFKAGDYVEIGGQAGTVKGIDLFTTELATLENNKIVVPNGEVWGKAVINYSAHPQKRLMLDFGIDYGDDIAKAMAVMRDVVAKDPRVLPDPEPWVAVTELSDSAVNLQLRVWCQAAEYWELKCALLHHVKVAFDANDITIPYPHITYETKASGSGVADGAD